MSKENPKPDVPASNSMPAEHKSVLQDALTALDKMQARLDAEKRKRHEPIAVVGMGCRFPGEADSPAAYWQLLKDGVDAVREVPATRFDLSECGVPDPSAPGETGVLFAGLVDDVDQFDTSFFEISPREAESLDPQHRLLLEVSWETLEHAAIPPGKLRGSETGVFVGITTSDYARMMIGGPATGLDAYTATGGALNAAAGRLAYVLGLNGPCMAIDTACSSSLVAVHLACQSLRGGECDLALAGGVNMLLAPEPFLCFSRWGMMAPDGRCKAFDAGADGFVRSEGCGLVALKRLSDAEADGDRILAVIRGSAVNQDGASSGLTVPNGLAQQALLRAAYKNAGVAPTGVDYVEAHGTGTSLGDPIEMEALGAVLGPERNSDQPFFVGSVKANLGHLESAAGIAGLIKTVLALTHEEIPPQQHFSQPSPQIDWDSIPVRVLTERTPWRSGSRPRIAGVSGFGFSGTNAHIVLSEAPIDSSVESTESGQDRSHLLLLSAKTAEALRDLVRRYIESVDITSEHDIGDLCYTAWAGRTHFPHRMAVMARSVRELRERLTRSLDEGKVPDVLRGSASVSGTEPRSVSHPCNTEWLAFLEQNQNDRERLLEHGGQLYCNGFDLDYSALYSDRSRRRADLPTYPFQRRRYWISPAIEKITRRDEPGVHPLLGRRVGLAGLPGTHVWQGQLDLDALPYLRDHQIQGRIVFPGTAYVEMALAATAEAHGLETLVLDTIEMIAPLYLVDGNVFSVQTTLLGDPASELRFEVYTRPEDLKGPDRAWTLNAHGSLRPHAEIEVAPLELEEIQGRCVEQVDGAEFYRLLGERGNDWGPYFQGIDHLWRCAGEALGRIEVPEALRTEMDRYRFQPAIADACGHPLMAIAPLSGSEAERRGAAVAGGIDEVRFYRRPTGTIWWSHVQLRTDQQTPENVLRGDIRVYDETGALFVETLGARLWYLDSASASSVPGVPPEARRLTLGTPGLMESLELRSFQPENPGKGEVEIEVVAAGLNFRDVLIALGMYEGQIGPLGGECAGRITRVGPGVDGLAVGDEVLAISAGSFSSHVIAPALLTWAKPARFTFEQAAGFPNVFLTAAYCLEHLGRMKSGDRVLIHAAAGGVGMAAVQLARRAGAEIFGTAGSAEKRSLIASQGVTHVMDSRSLDFAGEVDKITGGEGVDIVLNSLAGEFIGKGLSVTRPGGCFVEIGRNEIWSEEQVAELGTEIDYHRVMLAEDCEKNPALVQSMVAELLEAAEAGDLEPLPVRSFAIEDAVEAYRFMARAKHVGKVVLTLPSSQEDVTNQWLYQVDWETAETLPDPAPSEAAVWLIFTDRSGIGTELAEQIRDQGGEPVQIRYGKSFQALDEGLLQVRAGTPEDMTRMLQEVRASTHSAEIGGIVHLWSLDAPGSDDMTIAQLTEAQNLGCVCLLHLVHGLLESGFETSPRIWLVTKGVTANGDGQSPGIAQAPLWGLGRSLAVEHSELWGGLVDLEPGVTPGVAAAELWRELHAEDGETQVALRQSGRLVPRLARLETYPVEGSVVEVHADGAYLITGGLGGIGRELAHWLVERGARHVILVGRTDLPPRSEWDVLSDDSLIAKTVAIRALEAAGAVVHTISVDIGDETELSAALAAYRESGGPVIRGVFHAAGVPQQQALSEHHANDMWTIMGPKVIGGWLLHRLLDRDALDWFVLFSSASSVLRPPPLMGSYCAANAFLDCLTHYRLASGRPALTINWGTWGEVGMAAASRIQGSSGLRGAGTISNEQGLRVLERLMSVATPQVTVMPMDWDEIRRFYPVICEDPFLQRVVGKPMADGAVHATAQQNQEVGVDSSIEQADLSPIGAYLVKSVSDLLRLSGTPLDVSQPFSTLGFDSLMAVELKNEIESEYDVIVPIAELLDSPSIVKLECLLVDKLGAGDGSRMQGGDDGSTWEEGEL